MRETLYRTPNDRLFVARYSTVGVLEVHESGQPVAKTELRDEGGWWFPAEGEWELRVWLEKASAPEEAYSAVGFEVEEG